MAWPCKRIGKNKDTKKGIKIKIQKQETQWTTLNKVVQVLDDIRKKGKSWQETEK